MTCVQPKARWLGASEKFADMKQLNPDEKIFSADIPILKTIFFHIV